VIFAVLDVSLAVNLCINCSFFYIYSSIVENEMSAVLVYYGLDWRLAL